MKIKSKGFTLIELLVVIAIISLLSSVVLAAVKGVREKAKYSKFDTELLQLRTNIELYKSDHNGSYPSSVLSNSSLDALISELYSSGYYPVESIDYPDGYGGGLVWPSGQYSNEVYSLNISCGLGQSSSNSYMLTFFVDSSVLSGKTSNFLKVFDSGSPLSNAPGYENTYVYCLEI